MATKKQKYYVVWHGHKPGVYTSWNECAAQVKNFPNAMYRAYGSMPEAKDAFQSGPEPRPKKGPKAIPSTTSPKDQIRIPSISVDAACSGNPGAMEYRGVWTDDKTEIFHLGPVPNGTNNIGEFLAIVHALAWLKKHNDNSTPVYTDSRTAL